MRQPSVGQRQRANLVARKRTVGPIGHQLDVIRRSGRAKSAFFTNEGDHRIDPLAGLHIGEDERSLFAHQLGVARHHIERSANVGRKIDLVDHQHVGGAAVAQEGGAAGPEETWT